MHVVHGTHKHYKQSRWKRAEKCLVNVSAPTRRSLVALKEEAARHFSLLCFQSSSRRRNTLLHRRFIAHPVRLFDGRAEKLRLIRGMLTSARLIGHFPRFDTRAGALRQLYLHTFQDGISWMTCIHFAADASIAYLKFIRLASDHPYSGILICRYVAANCVRIWSLELGLSKCFQFVIGRRLNSHAWVMLNEGSFTFHLWNCD